MKYKLWADGKKLSEHKKKTNRIHFECKSTNAARALNYFKQTHPSNMTAEKSEKPLGYNCYFISILGSSG